MNVCRVGVEVGEGGAEEREAHGNAMLSLESGLHLQAVVGSILKMALHKGTDPPSLFPWAQRKTISQPRLQLGAV